MPSAECPELPHHALDPKSGPGAVHRTRTRREQARRSARTQRSSCRSTKRARRDAGPKSARRGREEGSELAPTPRASRPETTSARIRRGGGRRRARQRQEREPRRSSALTHAHASPDPLDCPHTSKSACIDPTKSTDLHEAAKRVAKTARTDPEMPSAEIAREVRPPAHELT